MPTHFFASLTPGMNTLPPELLDEIIRWALDDTMLELRLTSKAINQAVLRSIFLGHGPKALTFQRKIIQAKLNNFRQMTLPDLCQNSVLASLQNPRMNHADRYAALLYLVKQQKIELQEGFLEDKILEAITHSNSSMTPLLDAYFLALDNAQLRCVIDRLRAALTSGHIEQTRNAINLFGQSIPRLTSTLIKYLYQWLDPFLKNEEETIRESVFGVMGRIAFFLDNEERKILVQYLFDLVTENKHALSHYSYSDTVNALYALFEITPLLSCRQLNTLHSHLGKFIITGEEIAEHFEQLFLRLSSNNSDEFSQLVLALYQSQINTDDDICSRCIEVYSRFVDKIPASLHREFICIIADQMIAPDDFYDSDATPQELQQESLLNSKIAEALFCSLPYIHPENLENILGRCIPLFCFPSDQVADQVVNQLPKIFTKLNQAQSYQIFAIIQRWAVDDNLSVRVSSMVLLAVMPQKQQQLLNHLINDNFEYFTEALSCPSTKVQGLCFIGLTSIFNMGGNVNLIINPIQVELIRRVPINALDTINKLYINVLIGLAQYLEREDKCVLLDSLNRQLNATLPSNFSLLERLANAYLKLDKAWQTHLMDKICCIINNSKLADEHPLLSLLEHAPLPMLHALQQKCNVIDFMFRSHHKASVVAMKWRINEILNTCTLQQWNTLLSEIKNHLDDMQSSSRSHLGVAISFRANHAHVVSLYQFFSSLLHTIDDDKLNSIIHMLSSFEAPNAITFLSLCLVSNRAPAFEFLESANNTELTQNLAPLLTLIKAHRRENNEVIKVGEKRKRDHGEPSDMGNSLAKRACIRFR